MATGFTVRPNQYFDSVFLMGVNKRLSATVGVQQSAVLMGSPANKGLLAEIGVGGEGIEAARPNDLIVAVIADTPETVQSVLARLDEWLESDHESGAAPSLHTLAEGLTDRPAANLAVISVPGEYAALEARKAIDAGLHVFLFSSNVSLEDEVDLKRRAAERGLLVMGPDCGTSLIGGVGVGFANAVRRGPIGVVGAAGTGLQEFTCQIHNAGLGISHAIGTGSHDLSQAVGGATTYAALDALAADPGTQVIALVSKPPAPESFRRLLPRLERLGKPVIGCFFGIESSPPSSLVQMVETIDDAVGAAIARIEARGELSPLSLTVEEQARAKLLSGRRAPEQVWLRGVFSGGTFCYQAQQILRARGFQVHSNTPLIPGLALGDPGHSQGHTILDMGDDHFTLARPHPMIDGTLRRQRIQEESRYADLAVLLLDFVLGFNASKDPVAELYEAIVGARRAAETRGGELAVVASVCGTDGDPQDRDLQMRMLTEAGAVVFPSNAQAVLFCAALLDTRQEGP